MDDIPRRRVEDEIVFQNTYRLNTTYYKSTGDKQAFVLSHGKNMLVLKMVGYGDDVIRYYQLENIKANVWIGHHRYPTKGHVWHPGGAHPFIGLNEALVHNGDFANHASISEYLSQRNIYPLFLTDTEVAVQVFDLLHRIYDYPLEYVIEAMAPTTERDFTLLPDDKKNVYKMLQTSHMHCSPDGPWFFLIAQSDTHAEGGPSYRLTGITDTSMLRPQVFAYQENKTLNGEKVAIGFAASEKQGIDAALESLAENDNRFWSRADRYWNARGGSHTDGGAFLFTVKNNGSGSPELFVQDKFGQPVSYPTSTLAYQRNGSQPSSEFSDLPPLSAGDLFSWMKTKIDEWDYQQLKSYLEAAVKTALLDNQPSTAIQVLTLMMNQRYNTGSLRRSSVLTLVDEAFSSVIEHIKDQPTASFAFHQSGNILPVPAGPEQTIVVDARGYPPEGDQSLAREIHRLVEKGFQNFLLVHTKGHRFIGGGLGPRAELLRFDVYGSPGDYLASGIDGIEIHVHNNGQDQLAQIMKSGKLVVHGDVGQTFMYGAKGGQAYILGNAAGRPMINAVGKPRVVINGTCLDYLAESFMAGDPLNGGGFVILNGITFNEQNEIIDLDTPYPGGNLFSLASGGAIYVRDPHQAVSPDQLNGGEFTLFTEADWKLIKPYLEENARLFNIPLERLMMIDGQPVQPAQIYRKIHPKAVRALQAEESWVTAGETAHGD
jgi:glutamate synthase domain-containing protein 3